MVSPACVSRPEQRLTGLPYADSRMMPNGARCLFRHPSAGMSTARLDLGGLRRSGDVCTPRPCSASRPRDVFSAGAPPPPAAGGHAADFRHEKWGPRRGSGSVSPDSHSRLGRAQTVACLNGLGFAPCVEQVCRRGVGDCSPGRSCSPGGVDAAGSRSPSLERFEVLRAGNFDCIDLVCHRAPGECSPCHRSVEARSPRPDHLLRHRQESARWQSSDIDAACRLGIGEYSPRRDTRRRARSIAGIALPRDLPRGALVEMGGGAGNPRELLRVPAGRPQSEQRSRRPRSPLRRCLPTCQMPRRWEIPSPKDVVNAAELSMDFKWEHMSRTSRMQSADVRALPTVIVEHVLKKGRVDPDASTASPMSSRRCSHVESVGSCAVPFAPEAMDEEAGACLDVHLRHPGTEATLRASALGK